MVTSILFGADIFERQRVGGISRYFIEIARHLQSEHFCEVNFESIIHINRALGKLLPFQTCYLPFSPSRINLNSSMRAANDLYGRYLSTRKQFDIRHETFILKRENFSKSRFRVITVYDLIREKFTPNASLMTQRQQSIYDSDAIICISGTTARDLVEHYDVDSNRISVIPLGVEHSVFHVSKPKENLVSPFNLIYVGERDGYKNFSLLLDSFHQSASLRSKFRVLVFGKPWTPRERKLLLELQLTGHFIQLRGGDRYLNSIYQKSVALVVTSRYEGFGLPVLEAMASGCLVVSTREGSLAEICGGLDIPFRHDDPHSLEVALFKALDFRLSDVYSEKDLIDYSTQFTWSNTAQQTYSVYSELLKG
jgi:glycosyltransferase involved in cell wall biosynthesis